MASAQTFTVFTHPSLASAVKFATWQRTVQSILLTALVITTIFVSLGVGLIFWFAWQLALRKKEGQPVITVGDDGITITQAGKYAFIPWSRVAEVEEHEQGARVRLENGRVLQMFCAIGQSLDGVELALQLEKRHARAKRVEANELSVERIRRGKKSAGQWLDELRALDPRAGGYRSTTLTERELWEIAENPSAPADARAGAAFVLARVAEPDGAPRVRVEGAISADEPAQRLRVLAEATAQPELAQAIEAASAGEPERFARLTAKI
jgi:hypothetical protein